MMRQFHTNTHAARESAIGGAAPHDAGLADEAEWLSTPFAATGSASRRADGQAADMGDKAEAAKPSLTPYNY